MLFIIMLVKRGQTVSLPSSESPASTSKS